MGFFSWTCAKTGLPLMAASAWHDDPEIGPALCGAVLLGPEGEIARGTHDGYGRFGGIDLVDTGLDGRIDNGELAFVLSRWHAGETFADLTGRSASDPGQGFFHERDDLIRAIRETDARLAGPGDDPPEP